VEHSRNIRDDVMVISDDEPDMIVIFADEQDVIVGSDDE
jgi:hypothetical protein